MVPKTPEKNQENAPRSIENLFSDVELFLLPRIASEFERDRRKLSICPVNRMENIALEVSIADHIRTMQTIFRDSVDELYLGGEIRSLYPDFVTNKKRTTKELNDLICEGRVRLAALCRLSFGVDGIESIRSYYDLASAYAMKGQWPQVEEQMVFALEHISRIQDSKIFIENIHSNMKNGYDAALRVWTTFRILRNHALSHRGQIDSQSFTKELVAELGQISTSWSQNHLDKGLPEELGHPAQLAIGLNNFFLNFSKQNDAKMLGKISPSWGDVINYLRYDSSLMQAWISQMETCIIPQVKAVLLIPFRACDRQFRDIAHPAQLIQYLKYYPCAAKTLAGTDLIKSLSKQPLEVTLFFNQLENKLIDLTLTPQSEPSTISYELPITLEEYLALFAMNNNIDPLGLLKSQVLTLTGVCQIFLDKLDAAEDTLQTALSQVEALELDTEISSCELYNSIAQLMIMKHKKWQSDKKGLCEQEAHHWLETEPGKKALRENINEVKKSYKHKILGLSHIEAETRARNLLIRKRMKECANTQEEMNAKCIETAYRYLIRSHEILEDVHGNLHPSVATACLAVASVKNIAKEYDNAREWLSRSLRLMEKLPLPPARAIAFVQVQLAQVLLKQGHDEEGLQILNSAFDFHFKAAFKALTDMNKDDSQSQFLIAPISKNHPSYEDIFVSLDLLHKLISNSLRQGNKWKAVELCTEGVQLIETAFGWDSLQAVEWRKQVLIFFLYSSLILYFFLSRIYHEYLVRNASCCCK